MDEDRIKGSAEKLKGDVKEEVGRMTGDEKLKQEGLTDQAKGHARNTWGSIKDAIRNLAGR